MEQKLKTVTKMDALVMDALVMDPPMDALVMGAQVTQMRIQKITIISIKRKRSNYLKYSLMVVARSLQ